MASSMPQSKPKNRSKNEAQDDLIHLLRQGQQWESFGSFMKDWNDCGKISQKLIKGAIKNYCDYLSHDNCCRPRPTYIVCHAIELAIIHGYGELIADKRHSIFEISDIPNLLLKFGITCPYLEKILKLFYTCFHKDFIDLLYAEQSQFLEIFITNLAETSKQFKEIAFHMFSRGNFCATLLEKMSKLKDPKMTNKLLTCCEESNVKQLISHCSPQVRGELINFCFSNVTNAEKKTLFITTALMSQLPIDITKVEFRSVFQYNIPMLISNPMLLNQLFDVGLSLNAELCQDVVKMVLEKGRSVPHLKIICYLLKKGAKIESLVDVYSQTKGTFLHGATELVLETGDIEIFNLIDFEQAASCSNKRDLLKSTPLHVVMKHSRCDMVAIKVCRILCEDLKINPRLKDSKEKTAADYCNDSNDARLNILKQYLPVVDKTTEHITHYESMKQKPSTTRQTQKAPKKKPPKSKEAVGGSTKGASKSKPKHSPKTLPPSAHLNIDSPSGSTGQPTSYELTEDDKLENHLKRILSKSAEYFLRKKPGLSKEENVIKYLEENDEEIKDEDPPRVENENKTTSSEEKNYDVFYSPFVKKFFEKPADQKLVTRTLEIIKRLARGESNYPLVRKMHTDKKLPHISVYHSNIDSAKRIIWHKKVTYSPIKRRNCKVIVILDVILNHEKLNKAVERAINWIKQGQEEGGTYKVKEISEDNYEVVKEPILLNNDTIDVPHMMKDEYGAVQTYSIPEFVLKRIINFPVGEVKRFGLPMKLSEEEHSVVDLNFEEKSIVDLSYHKKTLLIVGRSGTGKTTCCLQRLWEEFLYYWASVNDDKDPIIPRMRPMPVRSLEEPEMISDVNDKTTHSEVHEDSCIPNIELTTVQTCTSTEEPIEMAVTVDDCDHLHQVFVTKSSYLCHEVKRRFYDLVSSHDSLWKQFHTFEKLPLPSSLHDKDISFPLFITSRNLLILMDGSLNDKSFFRRKNGKVVDIIKNSEQMYYDKTITDILENEEEYESDDNSDSENDDNEYQETQNYFEDNQPELTDRHLIEVTASYFKNQIWDKIAQDKKKVFDPILVWQEIKSFIKGSVKALQTHNGFLCKEDYMSNVGKNKAPNFADSREEIYSLFQKYQQYCKSPTCKDTKYFDECDLLFHIYQHRSSLPLLVHNFYIDEVQDFTEAELFLLLSCSQCPNGNFLCGDSAQSIMRGVSFRFTDVRSLFFELGQTFKDKCKVTVTVPDEPHYLTVNYRAHAGILKVADSVIELLGRFFPDSFDAIPQSIQYQSKSTVSHKPLLLYYNDPNELPHLLAGNQSGATREIEFGAHQAIIIPSKDTKLPESLEDAIVLTVLEAKGLEFNDVLLFNFFSESMVNEKSWEIVSAYTAIEIESSKEKVATKHKCTLKSFDESKHKTLNTELKCLYTALTRAKRNVWICDQKDASLDEEAMHPMYKYFLKKQLVKKFKLEESEYSFAAEESTRTPDEWKKTGDYLLSKQLFYQAEKCYIKARAESLVYTARAYLEVQQKSYQKAALYLFKADSINHERQLVIKAAMCLRVVPEVKGLENSFYYSQMALLYEKLGKVRISGEYYLLIKDFENFIRVSESKDCYERVFRRLLSCGEKFLALKKAVEYGDKIKLKGTSIGKLAYECVRHYITKGDSNAVRESISYLDSRLLRLKYLELNGFHKEVIELHISSSNYSQALKQAWKFGFYSEGVEIARKCKNVKEEVQFMILEVYAKILKHEDPEENFNSLLECSKKLEKCEDGSNNGLLAEIQLLNALLFQDIEACSNAMELFKQVGNTGGFLEAVNILLTVCDGSNSILCQPKDILEYSLKATRLAHVFVKKTLSVGESKEIALYMELNQMQKLLNTKIFLPPNQAFWLPSARNRSVPMEYTEIQKDFQNHLHQYCNSWLKSTKAVEKVLSSFRLHKQVQEKGLIPQNAEGYFSDYLTELSKIVELNHATNCFPDSKKILSNLFSPLSILHNHAWTRYHFKSLQCLNSIVESFTSEYNTILKAQVECQFTSLDQCLELWRLSLIINDNTKSLHTSLRNSTPSQHWLNGWNEHIFSAWVSSAFQLSYLCKVTRFLSTTYNMFMQPLGRSPIAFQSISDENLLYILVLQSLTSIYLLSLSWSVRLFVPKIFEYLMTNFNFLNRQSKSSYSIMRACVNEVQNWQDLSHLGRLSCSYLEKLLEFLLLSNCHVFSRVLDGENEALTRYYMVLILTISANLIVARPKLDNSFIYRNLVVFVTKLGTTSSGKPEFVRDVYVKLVQSQAVNDLFIIILTLLKNTAVMQQVSPNFQRSFLNSLAMSRNHYYPHVELKQVLTPNFQLLQQVQASQESQDTATTTTIRDQELEGQTEVTPDDEQETPVVEQDDVLMKKLKDNMIENFVCKVCNVQISIDKIEGEATATSSTLERQDSVEEDVFDRHIASDSHQYQMQDHETYGTRKLTFDFSKRDALFKLERRKKSPHLLPEDDLELMKIEDELNSIHTSIQTIIDRSDSWYAMTKEINEGINKLNGILRVLSKFEEKGEGKEKEVGDLEENDPESLLPADFKFDEKYITETSKNGPKRKGRKLN